MTDHKISEWLKLLEELLGSCWDAMERQLFVLYTRQGAVTRGLERAINSRVQQWHALLGQGPALSSGSGYQGWHLLVVPPNTRPSQVKGKA